MIISNVVKGLCRVSQQGIVSTCRRVHNGNGRFYTKKHEWVKVDAGVGTIGISKFAQESLGEVVFAQLPDVGKNIISGDECGALESVKAAGEVYSPVSGIVTEKNSAVESSPALINKSCYEEGWLFRLKLSKPEEVEQLMDQTSYDTYLKDLH
ncbi:glycine cleavage system H protein-like [Pieris napi]|uniref:glycine cleavage system H protein-like n=1 Tax=Pieris napi TaxID=78633 RepID=UPI001FB90868|nr:glycine cleavage system H protein-like [Pieris napi]